MEPQQSIQPDPPDDDPDQDPDQPPPYPPPALLDSALSLVAQPLASAAARVAASHPIAFPLDDLNDFNVDLSWAAPEIDSAFLNDTEYLQLGDDPQPPSPRPQPPPSHPLPSHSTTATAAIPHSTAHTSSIPTPTPHNHPPPPIPRSRASSLPRKPSRNRLHQHNPTHNPIPIAPRSLADTNIATHRNAASPAPRSMQALSSLSDAPNLASTPPRKTPEPPPPPLSVTAPAPAPAPAPFSGFPPPLSPHPMIPIMNMYPLQHHQSIFHPSHSSRSPHHLTAPDSTPAHTPRHTPRPSTPTQSTNVPLATVESTHPLPSHPPHPPRAPHQPFLTPSIPVMPPGIVPFDANIMPFFQMAYAAAAARYPHAVVPPLPARSPDAPPSILNPYTSDRSTTFNPNTTPSNLGQPTDLPAGDQATHQTNPANVKSAAGPVVVQKAGKQVFVPQQKAARLERHPVLGRLQLKSTAKPHVATSTGLESNYVAETNISVRDDQHKTAPAVARTARLPNSSTNAAPSSGPADEAAQRQQKKRLVWTQELHERFVKAINAVGINSAVPKTIVTIMNVDGLTTEHVKSHLQKYRNSMRKEAAEEERDRSGGAGPSSDLRHHQFGAPSTNGAQAIQTPVFPKPPGDTNRSSQVIREVATNPARNQTLPFLPSRMMALGGQVREILRPGVNTGSSKEITNSVSTPKSETNSVSHMPPPPSPKSPSKEDRACHRAGSSDAVPPVVAKKVRMAASAPQERRQNDTIKCSTREASLENAGPEGNANTTDDIMTGKNAARNDRGGEQGLPTAAVIGATEQDQRASVIKQSTNSVADISTLQNSRFETIAQAGDPQKSATTATKANARVENAPSASQDNRDLELELMKEETQQMQLQVQMMVYRTIAMEKKLEEIHSGRLNAEVSGRVDSSKRSTGGDATPLVASTGDNETQGEEVYKSEGAENAKETENVIVAKEIREPADGHKQKQSDVGTKKRPRSLASEGQTEVEALLGEQMGLQKRLENASALIDKRMKIDDDHDFVNQNRRGLKRDDTSAATGMIDGNDGKKNNERAGAKVACRQGRNG